MILDTIFNAKQYQKINPGIDRVLDEVTRYTSDHYPLGRITLDGKNLYMNLEQYQLHDREDGMAEAHRKYIDVMYMVEGVETIYVKPVDRLQNVRKEYDFEKDLLLADIDEDATVVRLEAGSFIILFPQDAHAPGCSAGSSENVKKIVGKIRIVPED
ncbi:MAG: YhcH/YjgK/YiaL family protein [Oliverpabstia sp.]